MKDNTTNVNWFQDYPEDQWLFPEDRAREEGMEAAEHLITRPGITVYDCPCGDARVSFYLAKKGAIVTGMDLNPNFIKKAKERFAAAGLEGYFTAGDMRDASYPGGCDLYFSWFNSFGYFSDEENRLVMQTIADCIKPGGRLVMENPIPREVVSFAENIYESSHGIHAGMRFKYDRESKRIDIYAPDNRLLSSVRLYDRQEYEEMYEACGLTLVEAYSEHFTPYSEDKKRMILIAEKRCH